MITYRVIDLAVSEAVREKVDVPKNLKIPEKKATFAAIRPRIGLEKLETERTVAMGCFGTTRENAGKQGQNAVSTLVNSRPWR
jgi:hypothetical protein